VGQPRDDLAGVAVRTPLLRSASSRIRPVG
jgi:hypothetical protein